MVMMYILDTLCSTARTVESSPVTPTACHIRRCGAHRIDGTTSHQGLSCLAGQGGNNSGTWMPSAAAAQAEDCQFFLSASPPPFLQPPSSRRVLVLHMIFFKEGSGRHLTVILVCDNVRVEEVVLNRPPPIFLALRHPACGSGQQQQPIV